MRNQDKSAKKLLESSFSRRPCHAIGYELMVSAPNIPIVIHREVVERRPRGWLAGCAFKRQVCMGTIDEDEGDKEPYPTGSVPYDVQVEDDKKREK